MEKSSTRSTSERRGERKKGGERERGSRREPGSLLCVSLLGRRLSRVAGGARPQGCRMHRVWLEMEPAPEQREKGFRASCLPVRMVPEQAEERTPPCGEHRPHLGPIFPVRFDITNLSLR